MHENLMTSVLLSLGCYMSCCIVEASLTSCFAVKPAEQILSLGTVSIARSPQATAALLMRINHCFVQKPVIGEGNVTTMSAVSTQINSFEQNKCHTGCQYWFWWLIKGSTWVERQNKVIHAQDQTRITTFSTSCLLL